MQAQEIPLPIYSILIPLYKEERALGSIIQSMLALDYPKHLLDIKLILEEDDAQTINSLEKVVLPKHFDIIKVPYSVPRTKPKALNYAMEFIKGQLVVIYDAEDRPDSDQLLKCAKAFDILPKDVICLQAKLNFYNEDRNLLTKFFSIEYTIWFEYLMPAIDLLNLPLPLGGNSNHFKVEFLRKIYMWDPYNVTEDADLGIRIYLENYRSKIIDSYTFEEAPSNLKNWILQRSRWIKGFMQTFLVFIKHIPKARKSLKLSSILFIIIFVGFSSFSFLTLPLFFIIGTQEWLPYQIMCFLNFSTTFIFMYFSAILVIFHKKQKYYLDYCSALFWPGYFLLHSIASYRSLYELIFKPFHWNKTEHFKQG